MAPEGTLFWRGRVLSPSHDQLIQRNIPEGPWPFRLAFFIKLSY